MHQTISNAIRHLIYNKELGLAKKVLHYIDIMAIKPNDIFFNKLIDFASKKKFITFAEFIFKSMIDNDIIPTIVTFNTLIDSYFKLNYYKHAWDLFSQLKNSEIKPDNFTYTTMINGIKCQRSPDIKKAFQLF